MGLHKITISRGGFGNIKDPQIIHPLDPLCHLFGELQYSPQFEIGLIHMPPAASRSPEVMPSMSTASSPAAVYFGCGPGFFSAARYRSFRRWNKGNRHSTTNGFMGGKFAM